MSKPETAKATSLRLPLGWKEQVVERYAKAMKLPADDPSVTFTAAVIYALGQQYKLRYKQDSNGGGRPPNQYQVTIATRLARKQIDELFVEYSQPWQAATLHEVTVSPDIPMTVVTVEAHGVRESSTMPGRTIGSRLARDIAAAIDEVLREAQ